MIVVLLLAAVIVAADQIIKYFATNFLSGPNGIEVITNLFNLVYVENRGAAFGIFQNQGWFFIIITILIIFFMIYILTTKKISSKLFLASSTLILGGAIGNMIDRIFRGFVIDYISLSFFPPVFNLADFCITFGAVLLIIYLLRKKAS